MGRRGSNNPRQMRSKRCGCPLCIEEHPPEVHGERRRRRDCVGSWQARYRDPAGKQKAKNFERKRDADAFLDSVRSRVRTGDYTDPKRGQITLAQWWDVWWPGQPQRRTTTVNRKLSNWRHHIEPRWGAWRLCDLTYMELQTWLTREVKGHHTRRKVLELLRAMLRGAVRDGRIPHNPCADIELEAPPKKHADDIRPPTRAQCALIREKAAAYYRPLLVFLEETGMRWGEATGLRWGHVDLKAQHCQVKEVLSEDKGTLFRQAAPKSAGGFRTVPLTPEAVAAVRTMVEMWRPSEGVSPIVGDGRDLAAGELVFRGPQGGVLTRHNFRRTWIPAIQAAGLARQVTNPETGRSEWWPRVHDLRHVFATRLKDLGVSEKDVQTVMGHERGSKVTWLYQHSGEEVAAEVLAVMAPEAGAGVRKLRAV